MDFIVELSGKLNQLAWGIPMLILLIGTGIFMTVRLGFLQFRKFGYVMSHTIGKIFNRKEISEGALSPIQSMTTALAGTVGTGNIAGVAGAIGLGGPGAIFWMWIAAIFGMCTKFAEITLAVHFRERNSNGEYVGGPMYYIKNGLGENWKWLGAIFSFFAIFAAIGTGNMTQINTIATSIGSIFKSFNPSITDNDLRIVYLVVGVVGAILATMVIFGGMKSIGAVTEKLVPMMALVYIVCSLIVIVAKADMIIPVLKSIIAGAFNPNAIGGGITGVGIQKIIKAGFGRGVFSNEAGLGTAPIAHAAADVKHPIEQGLFGVFEVFADTIIICSMTAIVILVSGQAPGFYGKAAGTDLTILAFGTIFGSKAASIIIALCISLFAFSTLLGWALYGWRSIEFIFGEKSIKIYKVFYILFIIVGANMKLALVWEIADSLNALMAIPNLIAIIALSPVVVSVTKDYFLHRTDNML